MGQVSWWTWDYKPSESENHRDRFVILRLTRECGRPARYWYGWGHLRSWAKQRMLSGAGLSLKSWWPQKGGCGKFFPHPPFTYYAWLWEALSLVLGHLMVHHLFLVAQSGDLMIHLTDFLLQIDDLIQALRGLITESGHHTVVLVAVWFCLLKAALQRSPLCCHRALCTAAPGPFPQERRVLIQVNRE